MANIFSVRYLKDNISFCKEKFNDNLIIIFCISVILSKIIDEWEEEGLMENARLNELTPLLNKIIQFIQAPPSNLLAGISEIINEAKDKINIPV